MMVFAFGCAWRWSRGGPSWQSRTHSRGDVGWLLPAAGTSMTTHFHAHGHCCSPSKVSFRTARLCAVRKSSAVSMRDAWLRLVVHSGAAAVQTWGSLLHIDARLDFRHGVFLDTKVILHGSSSGVEARRGSRGDPYESVGVLSNARSRGSTPNDQVAQW